MRHGVVTSLNDDLDCLRALGDPEKLSAADDCLEWRGVRGDEGMPFAARLVLTARSTKSSSPIIGCCALL